ncbi:MAG: Maf family nucleotide pyrophosphatase [Gammaproteobacteria bacterium]|nr:Maf family nucleotide pyrophosphatase [Gammaproteobacteria bacterium]
MLHLASRSPRRAELLRLIGVDFVLVDVEVDERQLAGEAPAAYVCRVAEDKARVGAAALPSDAVVLAADTTVCLDGEILGKPLDADDARRMLARLSGRTHEVLTAVVVGTRASLAAEVITTRVEFMPLDGAVIAAYVASGEPADKAGAYGIQGVGGALVKRIEGSYGAVVGLPLAETAEMLARAGIGTALRSA